MPEDAHKGGDLFEMAKDGTSIPGDAGKQNVIPSVPNPAQKDQPTAGGIGANSLHQAADNPIDTSGGNPGVGEGVSATGHSLPASTTMKPGGRGGK